MEKKYINQQELRIIKFPPKKRNDGVPLIGYIAS